MTRKEHHVVPNSKGGWDGKEGGKEKPIIHTETKKEAVDKLRKISKNEKSELIIHNKDGKIANCDSHGIDPNPPADKK